MAQVLNQTTLQALIKGQDYSPYVQFPFKVSNLLDEQLDEASLTLVGVPDKIFKPLTAVRVVVTSGNKTQTYSMLVAEDKADEIPSGSGRYKHELYLIEQTKFLECFVVRNLGFVNPLNREFNQIDVTLETIDKTYSLASFSDIYGAVDFKTPILAGQEYLVPSASDLTSAWESAEFPFVSGYYTYNRVTYGETTIINNGNKTVYVEDLWDKTLQYFTPVGGQCEVVIKSTVLVYNVDNPPTPGVTLPTDGSKFPYKATITCKFYTVAVDRG